MDDTGVGYTEIKGEGERWTRKCLQSFLICNVYNFVTRNRKITYNNLLRILQNNDYFDNYQRIHMTNLNYNIFIL